MTVDRAWATVGSINMDNRSSSINEELNLSIFDETLTQELGDQFEKDVADSDEIHLDRWKDRPPPTRLKEMVAGAGREAVIGWTVRTSSGANREWQRDDLARIVPVTDAFSRRAL